MGRLASLKSFFCDAQLRRVRPVFRGLLLLFDQRDPPKYSSKTGLGLLFTFVVFEYAIGPRAGILYRIGLAQPSVFVRVPLLCALCLLAVRLGTRASFRDIGYVSPTCWTATEWFYLTEVVLGACVIAIVSFASQPRHTGGDADLWIGSAGSIGVGLVWGFYQELIYRGILQTELTRRLGPFAGPLTANTLFTFGPLHFQSFTAHGAPLVVELFAATFATGLLFAYIFHRTRNIWIVGILHGIGDAF